jgi:hypothetical protein
MRWMSMTALLCMMLGCSNGPSETRVETASPDAFAGTWRSVTPSLEFIRLTVVSKSSEQDVLGARLTFSGVAWDGNGRIEGDSLVAQMTMSGGAESTGVIVAHASDAQTLRVQVRPGLAGAFQLTLVREN